MSGRIRLKLFRQIKKNLNGLGISWSPTRGRGSHGCFTGPNQETKRLHSFPIPRDQQREINIGYLKALRRHFGLTDKKWDSFFD